MLRVLIADDSVTMRDRLVLLISELPEAQVIGCARNGKEALDQARVLRPDVLILDLRLPQMTGLEVLKVLRKEQDRVFVIVLTNQDEAIYRERALAAGADCFLNKATQIDDLEMLVQGLKSLRFEEE